MIKHQYFRGNGVMLHCATAGPEDGEPIVLLHGFPEFWGGWQAQITGLAAAGYRVIAPDQRGYNISDKPRGSRAYRGTELVADICALLDTLNLPQATIVGHDWGGAVAWWLAAQHPDRVKKLIILNSPHPQAMRQALTERTQRLKSGYMAFFNVPILPEVIIWAGNWFLPWLALTRTATRGAFSAADRRRYQAAWGQPGALTGMLNWYRALLRHGSGVKADTILPPTMIIWGERDAFFVPSMAADSADYCDHARLHVLQDATHWLHHEQPDRINELILDFLHAETEEGRNANELSDDH